MNSGLANCFLVAKIHKEVKRLQKDPEVIKTMDLITDMNLKKNRSEVMGSILTDYNEKETLEAFYRDGKEDGIEKGRIQGIEQGREEGRISIAKTMKSAGEPLEKIIAYTQLSLEEIKNL